MFFYVETYPALLNVILDQVNKVSGIHTFLKAFHRQKLIQDIFDFFSIYSTIVVLNKKRIFV